MLHGSVGGKKGNCLTPYQKDLPKKGSIISKFNLPNNFGILVHNSAFSGANKYAENYSLLHHKLWFHTPKLLLVAMADAR